MTQGLWLSDQSMQVQVWPKDTHSWTQCVNTSEHKWALQMTDLADTYLAWKDGSTPKTTIGKFRAQYVDIFSEYCLLFSIHCLTL